MKLRFAAVVLLPCSLAHAEPRYTQNDFGGVGLLQTPTARMAPAGELSFNANRTEPYSRYSLSLQPLDWLEGTFRYTAITNRMYGSEALSGNQSYKDKAVDAKARLWQESHWLPEVALGFRDIGGTGLFSSEYFVANKRYKDFDFSAGIAWGYIGNRGDLDNPLGYLDDRFDTRPSHTSVGDVNTSTYFRGSPALFGGITYQTPWAPLSLKVEYDGNDYKHEPQNNNQVQDSPINIGAVYKLNDNIDLTAGWERGNTALFGITLHTNFVSRKAPVKTYDPPAATLPAQTPTTPLDWGMTEKANPCAGVRRNKETPRDFYADSAVWDAVFAQAAQELKDAMQLAYLTGQRPADVLKISVNDLSDDFLMVGQGKTQKRLRISLHYEGMTTKLSLYIDELLERRACNGIRNSRLITNASGLRMSSQMLRNRWDEARAKAVQQCIAVDDQELAKTIRQFQFRDIRPKAASEIGLDHASRLLGHSKEEITRKVYRRIGEMVRPTK